MSSPTGLDHAEAARRLAALYRTDNVEWARWAGWYLWVGCDECTCDPLTAGPQAVCWGKTACHGITRGCGCEACYNTVRAACLTALAARPPADLDMAKLG